MYDFQSNKANKFSLARRKLVFGHGVNDAPYQVAARVNGKQATCPYYSAWVSMLRRCYYKKFQLIQPTYIGCTVCEEWLSFIPFRDWMANQEWQGKELDKDIKFKGNSVYSQSTCLFIPKALNRLLNDSAATRGKHPIGVSFENDSGKYKASMSINGKLKNLGRYDTVAEASEAYAVSRKEKILSIIKSGIYGSATQYLIQHI